MDIYRIRAILRHYQILTSEIRDARAMSEVREKSYYNLSALQQSRDSILIKIESLIPIEFSNHLNETLKNDNGRKKTGN